MSLSCSCGDYDGDDIAWWYNTPDDYTTLQTKMRKRCCSCNELIDLGDTVLKFNRWRNPKTEIEEKIYGEGGEISIAPWHMCEECADLFFSLKELGFCDMLGDDMRESVKEYSEMHKAKNHHG